MARKPYIDEDVCIGCELCVNTAPEVFRMKENNIAEVYDPAGALDEEEIQEAIDNCPVSCIHWE